ncbi:MAG: hypothetical protein IJZ86_09590 [Bacteroides sp.]|nr:hypothetical protein [Bacteroides sp.]
MKQNITLVPVEDFNIDTLREAFLQGRLYIRRPEAAQTREESIRSILRYVSRIDACASCKYLTTIGQLWERLLRSPELGDLFFLNRYSNTRGLPNWYRVNAVVLTLLEHGVYDNERYTSLQLHLLMEQTTKRTNHYSGMNRYLPGRKEVSILLQLFRHDERQ